MADDNEKFPDFQPVNLINPVLEQQNKNPATQWGYIQSASRELVAFLKVLTYKRCVETKIHKKDSMEARFTSSNPPYILICGHYVHYGCRYVKENRLQQYKCRNCKYRNRFKGELWNDAVFKGFYEAIEEKGYPCIGCKDVGERPSFHPKTTHKKDDLEYYRTKATYLCVWCAKKSGYRRHYLRLLEPVDEQKADFSEGELHQLNSVDCTLHCSQFPNVQCCRCIRPMIYAATLYHRGVNYQDPTKKGAEHLPCGHIRCKGCKERGGQVYCNLCDKTIDRWKNQDIEGTVSHFSKDIYLKENRIYVNNEETNIDYDMIRCVECNAYHPITNGSQLSTNEFLCVWCKVAGKLEKRKGKWLTREANNRGREQEKGRERRSRSKSLSKKIFGSKEKSPDEALLMEDDSN